MKNIKKFFVKNKDYSIFTVRIGLALVLLWFGIDEIRNQENWFVYFPQYLMPLLPFSLNAFFIINGIFEIITGFLLLIGFYTRFVAFIVSLHLLSITIALGYNDVAVRDFGLSMAAISLIFSGAGNLSLDNKLKKE